MLLSKRAKARDSGPPASQNNLQPGLREELTPDPIHPSNLTQSLRRGGTLQHFGMSAEAVERGSSTKGRIVRM